MVTVRKPIHPGAVLKEDVLAPIKFSVSQAAQALSEFVNEKADLEPEMAERIARATLHHFPQLAKHAAQT